MRVVSLVVWAACVAVAVPAFGAAPGKSERIHVKTPTRTFTLEHELALEDGRIWWRPNPERTGVEADWRLMGPEGLPFRDGFEEPPKSIRAISSDLRFIVAISDTGRVYDVELPPGSEELKWEDGWGMPLRMTPAPVRMPPAWRTAAVSLLQDTWSEDIDGNPHQVLGIHTLYVLLDGGHTIAFNDPWLPPNEFAMRFSGPERGRFTAVNLAASGSLLMVVDATGALWTRLIDFDTMGGNPGIRYSHERRTRVLEPRHAFAVFQSRFPMWFDTRTLPPEPWKSQPRPPGRTTAAMSIVQTGHGNAARELRIEGLDGDGATGYWFKPVSEGAWAFRRTGQPLTGPLLEPDAKAVQGPPLDADLLGKATFADPRLNLTATMDAKLGGFNFYYDEITIELAHLGRPLKLELRLDANIYPLTGTEERYATGAILVPAALRTSREPKVAAFVNHFFPRREWTPVDVRVSPTSVLVFANQVKNLSATSFALMFERAPAPATTAAK